MAVQAFPLGSANTKKNTRSPTASLFSLSEQTQVTSPLLQRPSPCITPTRSLAAQQCGQVRTELALALGRLSTRSSLVSNTRTAARRASNCSRTLLLRLVDLELRCWRGRAATAAASGFREVMSQFNTTFEVTRASREGGKKHKKPPHSSSDILSARGKSHPHSHTAST